MKIANANIYMESTHSYEEVRQDGVLYNGRNRINGLSGGTGGNDSFSGIMIKNKNIRTLGDFENSLSRVRYSLLSLLVDRLRGANALPFMSTFSNGMGSFGSQDGMSAFSLYQESESVTFDTRGIVTTEDGRTIDFGVSLEMSRSYLNYAEVDIPTVKSSLIDPLVINIDAPLANISDQKFKFDLDCDDIEDEISTPGSGSGFLALDLNGDGIINDGSELFGTKSGNGFADLAKYDSDGNGWIDENDPIFERLKVWYKDANGRDVLMNLKEADVGAICLNAASTEFSMKNASNDTNAVIRKTGVFLKESGGVGTVQHIDLAARKNKMLRAYA